MLQLKKLIQFQGCWLAIVFGQVYNWPTQGFLVAGLLYAWSLYEDRLWKKEIIYSLILGFCGWSLDCALVKLSLFSFPQFVGDFAPYWMIVLWCSFSLGLEDFYPMLTRAPIKVLCLIGATLGPVSYYALEEFGLIYYSRPLWISMPLHGLLWAGLFYLIVRMKFRFKC